jgi:5-methylcytosine-specific restriction endonuclease McrA
VQRYQRKHPEQRQAHSTIGNAIQSGKLLSANHFQCSYCPRQAEDYHHIHGYKRKYWLDIVPICKVCHRKFDKKVNPSILL